VGLRGIGVPHAEAHASDPLAEFVAVCDTVRERAEKAAEKYGVRAYSSLREMLENEPDLDLVDVCTGGYENGSWHYHPAMEAMSAGKHVLVEKPLSSDVHQAREMVALAEEQGVYLACNLNHYFTPPAERARAYLDAGEIGELVFCLCKMGFQGGEPEKYRAPGSPKVAGFPYFHLKAFLSHPLSVMRYFCGDVTHVQAFLNRPGFRRSAGDVLLSTASLHLRFANDAVGYLLSQRGDASYGLGGWWSVEVGGTRGTFCIENCIERVTFWKAPDGRGPGRPADTPPGEPGAPVVTDSGTHDFGQTFARRIHAFLEDVSQGVPRDQLRGSGRDALAALEYTYAAIESYENGGALVRPHPLPPLTGEPHRLKD
ncbi:MAG: Gfo/Idh/MocA family oxidoreductase, partial [Armatimonadetes bacterium]|nr:Gfo/Idh/MocA family oxidoreductase [Armatimonadota bacterium]